MKNKFATIEKATIEVSKLNTSIYPFLVYEKDVN